jgi:hypothetical protein
LTSTTKTPLARVALTSVLEGLVQLFSRVGVSHWRDFARTALEADDPRGAARIYLQFSQGSAPGTFHDYSISAFNRHPVTERQEPWINELLTTFQAIGLQAARVVAADGEAARLPASLNEVANQTAGIESAPPRASRMRIYGMRCTTCETRFILDHAVDSAAAQRWSLFTAPSRIGNRQSVALVAAAFEPDADPATRAELEHVRPAIEALGLPAIRLPYNRPDRGPEDPCPVCGAVTWQPTPWWLRSDPLRLISNEA